MSTASKEIRHIFIWTRSFITAFTVALHMSLSWARSIQNTSPHHTPWRSILIIFSHLRLSFPSGLFLCGLPSKILDALCFQVSDAVTLFRCFGCTNGSLQVRSFVKCFVTWWFVTVKICFVSPNPRAGGPPLVACPLLRIQYIRSYPPYWRPFLHPQIKNSPCRGGRNSPRLSLSQIK